MDNPADDPGYLKAIGNRIRSRLESLGMPIDSLAIKAGMSKTGLWQIETGKSEPMARTLVRLSDVLGVSIDCLLLRC